MPAIKPIQTEAYGRLFRSRLEARCAVFLTEMGMRWEYEPEGYELPSGRYLPDFKVCDPNWDDKVSYWVECKSGAPNAHEVNLARELSAGTKMAVAFFEPQLLEYIRQLHFANLKFLEIWGEDVEDWPKYPLDLKPIEPGPEGNNVRSRYITARPSGNGEWIHLWDKYSEVNKQIGSLDSIIPHWRADKAFAAVNKALKARFEHGTSVDY